VAVRPPGGGRRRARSQHFLASREIAARIVRDAGVGPADLVVEIGAGTGVLTAELARRASCVVAIEIDPRLAARLERRFAGWRAVEVVEGDALAVELPAEPYRVVANLPFSGGTALLRRLLDDPRSPLQRAHLVLQWEVARMRAGRPCSALGACWAPWWRFRLGRRIPRTAFHPRPSVDAGMLIAERRSPPLLPAEACPAFAAFVRTVFDGTLVHDLDAGRWAALFDAWSGSAGR
jgi:23S rRNA (adenine-N6)-dimethyltransferase